MKKTILITGASSGLGKATAKYFETIGWKVAATMRSPENEMELSETDNLKKFKMDVTDVNSVQIAIEQVIDTFKRIDVIVNNAGTGIYGALELVTESDINQIWDTNVRGPINVIRAGMKHYRKNKTGMFINVSSVMGLSTGMPLISLYNMSKFALEGLSEGLYYEMKPLNIDIRIIEPGGFSSRLNKNKIFNRREDMPEYNTITNKIEGILNHYDDLPLGSKEEIIQVIYTLATKKSEKFRTVIGKEAVNLMEAREKLSIEDFLNANLMNFS